MGDGEGGQTPELEWFDQLHFSEELKIQRNRKEAFVKKCGEMGPWRRLKKNLLI